MRAYAPSTLPEVRNWYETGQIPSGARIHAVTAALRAENPHADEEELEFLATKAAEEASTVAAVTSGRRRTTVAVEVPLTDTRPVAGGLTSVELTAPVPLADWVALFVDDLEWYAVQELPFLTD